MSRHLVARSENFQQPTPESPVDPEEEQALIDRIVQGRVDDFALLLGRYQGYVCKILSGLLPAELVTDMAHEVFVEAFRSLAGYQRRTAFKHWLAGIALKRCQDHWRHRYRRRETPLSTLAEEHQSWLDAVLADEAGAIHARNEAEAEAREILSLALATLSPKDRLVVTLVHLEGCSVRETAAMLGISSINVKVRAHRSRKALRTFITALLVEGDQR